MFQIVKGEYMGHIVRYSTDHKLHYVAGDVQQRNGTYIEPRVSRYIAHNCVQILRCTISFSGQGNKRGREHVE